MGFNSGFKGLICSKVRMWRLRELCH